MRKTIDIEKLLQWAVRDELPKGQAVSASPWQMITQFATLGVRVQTSGFAGDAFGFTPGAPHQDAIIIADAIRALGNSARFVEASEVLPLFGELAGIAGSAVDAILSASFDPRSIVISKAIQGTRPKWEFECPTPRRMFVPTKTKPRPLVHGIDDAGDIVAMKKNEGRALKRDGEYNPAMMPRSPIEWCDPSPVTIADARAEYIGWHSALVSLANDLTGKLQEFEPTAPTAPRMPWITGAQKHSRVWSDGKLFAVALPVSPKRGTSDRRPIESPIASETRTSYNRASRDKIKKPASIGA